MSLWVSNTEHDTFHLGKQQDYAADDGPWAKVGARANNMPGTSGWGFVVRQRIAIGRRALPLAEGRFRWHKPEV